jgi:hypothetical protein
VQSSEVCRIFGDLEEARANSREVSEEHWTVRCFIYDHTGAQVSRVSNINKLGKFAAAMYAGIFVWVAVFAAAGMAILWILFNIMRLPFLTVQKFSHLGWFGWAAYVFAGILVGILIWYLRIRFAARRVVDRMEGKFRAAISVEEMKRFEALKYLHSTKDPVERERLAKLAIEYQKRISEAWKK